LFPSTYIPLHHLTSNHFTPQPTSYNKKENNAAAAPANIPVLPSKIVAAPVKAAGELVLDAVPVVVALAIIVKLAQVNLVVLEECTTILLSPKKYGEPGVVLKYRSE